MRVLMFGWEFPPHISGGLGTACFGLTQGLLQQGVDVLFVVPRLLGGEDDQYVRFIDASTVDITHGSFTERMISGRFKYLAVMSALTPYTTPEKFAEHRSEEAIGTAKTAAGSKTGLHRFSFSENYGTNLFEEVGKYALVGGQIATDHHFDVIHAHDWLTYPAGIAAKAACGKPLVIHVHATEYDRSGDHINREVYDIERQGMLEADQIITVSNLTRDVVIHKYGIDASKVVTIHNGVSSKPNSMHWPKPLKEKIVTFLGRITFQKGPEYFIEAARLVLEKNRNVRFVMAGSGDMMHRMIRLAAQYKISPRFHFTGFLRGQKVERLLSMSHVFVMPSVSEPFGIAPLEALQARVPVIISKQSGVSEVLQNAVKVDFWDTHALSDAILGLLKYPQLSGEILRNGQQEIAELTWDLAAQKVGTVYESVLKLPLNSTRAKNKHPIGEMLEL